MANACPKCNGSGKIPSYLNQTGFKQSAGMAMDVCPACAGTGKDRYASHSPTKRPRSSGSSDEADPGPDNPFGAAFLVWAYGLLTALIMGVSSESAFDIWWPVGAFLGFGGGAIGASLLVMFKATRIILWLGLLLIVGAVIYAIRSASG